MSNLRETLRDTGRTWSKLSEKEQGTVLIMMLGWITLLGGIAYEWGFGALLIAIGISLLVLSFA